MSFDMKHGAPGIRFETHDSGSRLLTMPAKTESGAGLMRESDLAHVLTRSIGHLDRIEDAAGGAVPTYEIDLAS